MKIYARIMVNICFLDHLTGITLYVTQVTTEGFEFIHASKVIKKFIATFPKLINIVSNGINKKATVVNVAADGKITKHFDDSEGKVIRFVTTAIEFEDHLYLGSLNTNFIGKFPLKAA